MALFQKPATTEAEIQKGKPLSISPDDVALMDEATWYAKVYRGGDLPQLTVRAVLMGALLGFLLAFTNLYIGLKTGWAMGVAITACILSYSLWNGLMRLQIAKTPMSILETNCMQSTASAAGYSTGSSMVSAIAALLVMSSSTARPGGEHLPWPILSAWTFFLAMLGVCMAIPMKRAMINKERLRFPSGLAAATTLQSLYSNGGDAIAKARSLFVSAFVAGLTPLLMDLRIKGQGTNRSGIIPASSPIFDSWLPVLGHNPQTGEALKASDWTFMLDHKLVMIAAGALVGLRVSIAMVVGGLLLAYWVGPAALAAGALQEPGAAWREIGIWVGAPMMVASGLLSFAWQWRSIGRAFKRKSRDVKAAEIHAHAEVPNSWFVWGVFVSGIAIVWLSQRYFNVPWYLGIVAVAMTYFLSLVACRVTGESDITPVGAMGQLTQLTFGVLLPQRATANLMTSAITSSASSSAADLLTDLKSGYLLGADPRRQFLAQFLGIFSGTIATVVGFYLLVPDATALTGVDGRPAEFPAPGAQSFLAVARVFQNGIESLSPMARTCMFYGFLLGIALAIAEKFAPPKVSKWLPSATGLGLGFILPFQYPLSMLIGAVGDWVWERRNKASADLYIVPVSSGVVAGESVVGVLVAAVNNFIIKT